MVVRKAVVKRSELTDGAWERIAPHLPANGRRGKQWKDHRTVVNGILWKLRTGAPWRDLPERYGSWQTCYDRFVRWRRDGTWDRLLSRAQTKCDAASEVEWEVSVDQHCRPGASARGRRPPQAGTRRRKKGVEHHEDEALGRSRGGLSTKVHLACDGQGRPLSVIVTPGQRHESTQLEAVLDAIRVARPGVGRPRRRPKRLIADKGYSSPSCRSVLRKRGIAHTIPERRDQQERRSGRPGRKLGLAMRTPTGDATWWSGA
jgi:transposase